MNLFSYFSTNLVIIWRNRDHSVMCKWREFRWCGMLQWRVANKPKNFDERMVALEIFSATGSLTNCSRQWDGPYGGVRFLFWVKLWFSTNLPFVCSRFIFAWLVASVVRGFRTNSSGSKVKNSHRSLFTDYRLLHFDILTYPI